MMQRESFTVELDESTAVMRFRYLGLLVPNHVNALLFFPCVFVYYLGPLSEPAPRCSAS